MSAIENVCRQRLSIPPEDPCTVTFHTSGLLNKLYIIDCHRTTGPLIMRVSLPVYPGYKTRGEVATLRWVHKNTTAIPVPEVFAFDDSNDNEIGFEWILMERIEGVSAYTRWRTMSMEQKVGLTEKIATFQAELSVYIFSGIGTLQLQQEDLDQPKDIRQPKYIHQPENLHQEEDPLENVTLGILVSHEIFRGDHLHYDIPRGPFPSTYEWQKTLLDIIVLHQRAVLKKSDDEDDREDAEDILFVAQKLLPLVSKVFPPPLDDEMPVPTALYHQDLHLDNILVNEEGKITAIIDWECVSAMPLWMLAPLVPKFLDEPAREEEPIEAVYANKPADERADSEDTEYSLYYIHLMEWEATQLRKVYKARLSELCRERPLAKYLSDDFHGEIDLIQAVSICDGIWVKKVGRWVDSMEKGEMIRLVE